MAAVEQTATRSHGSGAAPGVRRRVYVYDRHATVLTTVLDIRIDRCRAYAQSHGWDLAGIWLDLGDNALTNDRRPQFDAMCRALENDTGPTVCLVDGFDRLTRDVEQRNAMQFRVAQAGSHCETAGGESDAPAESRRRSLRAPH
ncbi:Resolvase, N terminal domain [Streptomyces sp. DpondAA-D4]|nr:Resolvase, N terminal domain [Streptomyces sp. DpondAA-D4]